MKLLLVNIVIVTMFCQFVAGAPLDITLAPISLMESLHSVLFDSNILTTHPGTTILLVPNEKDVMTFHFSKPRSFVKHCHLDPLQRISARDLRSFKANTKIPWDFLILRILYYLGLQKKCLKKLTSPTIRPTTQKCESIKKKINEIQIICWWTNH